MSPQREPCYFFLAFFLFVAFFRLGAFFAAPLEAAALARLRFIFMSFKPPVPTKRRDSMEVATESRMELRKNGSEASFFARRAAKIESQDAFLVS